MFKVEYLEYKMIKKSVVVQDIKDLVDVLINIVNNEEIEKRAYDWACNAHWGDTLTLSKYNVILKCIYDEAHDTKPFRKHSMRNDNIVKAVIDAYSRDAHFRIYEDGCWWVDLEKTNTNKVRFWVGYEDKRNGRCNGGLYSIHKYQGAYRARCSFKVKQAVADKILSAYKALESHRLV